MPLRSPAHLLDLLLPRRCVGCGVGGEPLCAACLPREPPTCTAVAGLAVCAAAGYDGAVRAALLRYKERGRRDLAPVLAGLLGEAVRAAQRGDGDPRRVPVLIPVPSARAVAAARGGDHVARLARRAAVDTGVRCAPDALVLTRRVLDSAGLAAAERRRNLSLALRARPAPPGRAALLVDDIVTTGATLTEAARALRAGGWPVLGAAVVAATPRRYPDDTR